MQKVEGSSPFSRSQKSPAQAGFSYARARTRSRRRSPGQARGQGLAAPREGSSMARTRLEMGLPGGVRGRWDHRHLKAWSAHSGECDPLAVATAELQRLGVAGGGPVPAVALTDKPRSAAYPPRPWRLARIEIRREIVNPRSFRRVARGDRARVRARVQAEHAASLRALAARHRDRGPGIDRVADRRDRPVVRSCPPRSRAALSPVLARGHAADLRPRVLQRLSLPPSRASRRRAGSKAAGRCRSGACDAR